ncbi:hypothetical protein SARC_09338 [Sphaeroforma arctica JP610]|uniref:Uncharacterized protein n=1 Tax=Sphaeroforma arctica JP610 TaxID=667725 RepID=A0A0L0FP16_9EUKA|nr:hypothetical protein SARC_09338 [Sphaeroforma arctica JP610]KNC78226.1 hypothetical protein SARC_09338 [Sphaeroforma arctica JP610]|eukprot:XP_014152128.1 hypothetical protein SARC_09338 [Sphaeroforma arctica JP610]
MYWDLSLSICFPETSGRTALETAFDGMTKGMVPEIKHSEAKHHIRAANAIRRKTAPYPGSYEWVTEAVEKVEGEAKKKKLVPKGILETGSAFASKDEGVESEFDDEDRLLRATPQVSMRTLFELLRPETNRMAVAMGAVLVSSLASLAFPSAVGQVVDSVSATNPDGPSFETAQQIILAMLGVVGVGSTAVAVRVSQLNIVSEQVARTLRKNVFECMVYQKLRFFEENETGRLVNRLSTDTSMVASTLTDNVARCIKAGTAVFTSTGFLLSISPQLTGVTLLVLPVFGVAAYTYGEYRKKLAQILLTRYAKENQVSMERLQGIRTVHSFTAEPAEVERYKRAVDRSFGLAKTVGYAEGAFLAGGFAVAQCTLLGVLYYGGSLMVQDALSVGQLTSFCMYTGYLFVSVGQVSVAMSEFLKAQGAARRVFSVIDTSNLNRHIYPMKDPEGAIMPDMTNFSPDIELKNVNFAYPTRPDIQVLKNVSLSLQAGHTLAICGGSGSGKSTLGLLLGQYYDVDEGSVTIGGYEASKLPLGFLRTNIAEVTQMPLLFSGTVKENIKYGNPDATDEQIYEAAKTANAHGFIQKLPNGYDTQCGERGKALSGGQMQRVCIARAVIKDSPIYIMDEATSALDAESEQLVVEALQKVMKGRTAIVFTHHLNVLKAADMVAVMDSGQVVQAGKYEELIQQEGPLKRIAATLQ